MTAEYLADTSAIAGTGAPRWPASSTRWSSPGLVATCGLVDLALLALARDRAEYARIATARRLLRLAADR